MCKSAPPYELRVLRRLATRHLFSMPSRPIHANGDANHRLQVGASLSCLAIASCAEPPLRARKACGLRSLAAWSKAGGGRGTRSVR
jgi:hypothetical protein